MLNNDYTAIGFTLLVNLYLLFNYGGNFLIPIIVFSIFYFVKTYIRYLNIMEYIKYSKEDKVGYEIYEIRDKFVVQIFLVTFLACVFNLYHLQFFFTILLLIDKYREYVHFHMDLDNVYLHNYYLTGTVLLSSLLLTVHMNQIEESNYIKNIIAFAAQNCLTSITYESYLSTS